MSDLRDTMRDAADRHRPPDDWYERVHERVRTRRRNRRIRAGVVGVGVSLVLAIPLVAQLTAPDQSQSRVGSATACGAGKTVPPTGWWRGNGSVADAAGGRDALLHGNATYGPGVNGSAFKLDGEGDFVEVPDDDALNVGSDDFTVSLWVRFTSTEREQVLIEDWIETFDSSTSTGWTLTKLKSNAIGFATGAPGAAETDQVDLPVDTWIHVAARRSDGTLSIFVNGALAAANAIDDAHEPLDSSASLKFGRRGSPDDTPSSLDTRAFFLNGQLDEVKLFVGRGLSDETILDIFESRSSCIT